MGAIQIRMESYMKVRGYSERSIKLYTMCLRVFTRHHRTSPLAVSAQRIESFFLHLREEGRSDSTIRIYYESLKLFYTMVGMRERLPPIRIGRSASAIPYIPSRAQVLSLLRACSSLKFRTLFSLIYSAGLRVSEAANLQLADIDLERRVIFVRNGKNKKNRYTILAEAVRPLLEDYLSVYRPSTYLFYRNRDITEPISTSHIQRTFAKLVEESGAHGDVRVHTLRHCFATHLLEQGTSIFYIMHLLGHSNIQTTMVYLHMRELSSLSIRSPLDHDGSKPVYSHPASTFSLQSA